uniref:Glutathione S-transferase n=1 Tax=Aegilops tauschii TaxID=37682 RepID=R7WFR7_AEGTA
MVGAQEQGLKLLVPRSGVSIYAIRVQMALAMKGLAYDYLPADPGCKSDLLLTSNPVHKKLPVLIHGGRPVCESLIIVEYLDDGLPMFPSSIGILNTANQQERADKVEETLAAFGLLEAALAECSKGGEAEGPFFGGGSLGVLDIALGCYIPWFEAIGRLAGVPPFLDAARTPKAGCVGGAVQRRQAVHCPADCGGQGGGVHH